jgi:hypothetical protein
LPHQNTQPTDGQGAAVEVEQVDSVEAQQVGLYGVTMFVEEVTEAR